MTITTEMKTALDLIENTKQPVYITGKAGTGKTTLLRYIVSSIKKKIRHYCIDRNRGCQCWWCNASQSSPHPIRMSERINEYGRAATQ